MTPGHWPSSLSETWGKIIDLLSDIFLVHFKLSWHGEETPEAPDPRTCWYTSGLFHQLYAAVLEFSRSITAKQMHYPQWCRLSCLCFPIYTASYGYPSPSDMQLLQKGGKGVPAHQTQDEWVRLPEPSVQEAFWCETMGRMLPETKGHCRHVINVKHCWHSTQYVFLIRAELRSTVPIINMGMENSAKFHVFAMKLLPGNIKMAFIT